MLIQSIGKTNYSYSAQNNSSKQTAFKASAVKINPEHVIVENGASSILFNVKGFMKKGKSLIIDVKNENGEKITTLATDKKVIETVKENADGITRTTREGNKKIDVLKKDNGKKVVTVSRTDRDEKLTQACLDQNDAPEAVVLYKNNALSKQIVFKKDGSPDFVMDYKDGRIKGKDFLKTYLPK